MVSIGRKRYEMENNTRMLFLRNDMNCTQSYEEDETYYMRQNMS